MESQISPSIKSQRRQKIMAIQQSISNSLMAAHVGKLHKVLVEKKGNKFIGRTESDSPDIDGRVNLRGSAWKDGTFQMARIVNSTDYDLVAERAANLDSE
jgi:ribosomal protein S12 methylthiotransferase